MKKTPPCCVFWDPGEPGPGSFDISVPIGHKMSSELALTAAMVGTQAADVLFPARQAQKLNHSGLAFAFGKPLMPLTGRSSICCPGAKSFETFAKSCGTALGLGPDASPCQSPSLARYAAPCLATLCYLALFYPYFTFYYALSNIIRCLKPKPQALNPKHTLLLSALFVGS